MRELNPEATGARIPVVETTLSRSLAEIAAAGIQGVRTSDLCAGDWVIVRTKNSVYSLTALGEGRFTAIGGWFATSGGGADGTPVRINGCTWGGHAIATNIVAAPGMCIEFGNGVRTTRVREVQLIRHGAAVTIH